MNKVIIPIIVVVVVAVIGFVMVRNQSTTQPTNSATVATSQTASPTTAPSAAQLSESANTSGTSVEYTSAGFNPKSVSIKVGQSVTWTNNDEDGLWVASNPHPVHTDYPGFDALKSISKGETYSFTFTKAGTWGYHNHLNPKQGGEVVVTQ